MAASSRAHHRGAPRIRVLLVERITITTEIIILIILIDATLSLAVGVYIVLLFIARTLRACKII